MWTTGLAISIYLLSGPAVWGGIGYAVDRLVGTNKVFTGTGMVLGAVGAIYLVYLRYGRGDESKGP